MPSHFVSTIFKKPHCMFCMIMFHHCIQLLAKASAYRVMCKAFLVQLQSYWIDGGRLHTFLDLLQRVTVSLGVSVITMYNIQYYKSLRNVVGGETEHVEFFMKINKCCFIPRATKYHDIGCRKLKS